jgi:predicted DsbA family dithiol-disulfide isomerase
MDVTLDLVSDVVCPWCWIGLRNAQTAIAALDENLKVQTSFRPFFLDAGIPEEGLEYHAYMDRKFPDKAARKAGMEHLQHAGAQVGIDFRFDKITKRPNTLNAHRLIRWAEGQGKGWVAKEALFNAFFTQGRDVGDKAVLIEIGCEIGLDEALLSELYASDRDVDQIKREVQEAQQIGVSAVPTFIVARKRGVSGAQPPEVLEKLLTEHAVPA